MEDEYLTPMYAARGLSTPVPRYRLPEGSMPAGVAAKIITDELNLDGNPALNLASFVTTWMEPEADQLIASTLDKNFVDADEYPQTVEIHDRCVNMIAGLFNAPERANYTGCATVGSSEAIHLAGLAMKWRWRAKRQAANLPDDRPNIVMGHNVQVCWEKFARYFDVEARYVPLTENRYVIGVDEAMSMVDERTIGVVGILGSTYTGEYEPVAELAAALDELQSKTGLDVPLHVDAASGGFVAPFLQPDFEWDFRIPRVCSINTSGHKYGLVYPGIGWIVWRDESYLPENLIFHVNYLGGDHPTFQLNFSRGASQIIAQYYNLLRLGRQGYTSIMRALQENAKWLAGQIGSLGVFEIVNDGNDLPVVCFKLTGTHPYTEFDISDILRERGWIVPAYTMAPDAEHIAVLRVVVREGLSRDLAGSLVEDLSHAIAHLETGGKPGLAAKKRAAHANRAVHADSSHADSSHAASSHAASSHAAGSRSKTHGVC
ncbi:MAG: glutamate decarboxylase [Acidimicrobiales bacterium]